MERERIKQFDHFGLFENGPRLSLTVAYLLLSCRPNAYEVESELFGSQETNPNPCRTRWRGRLVTCSILSRNMQEATHCDFIDLEDTL